MRSEKEKMLAGELYLPGDPDLAEARKRARKLLMSLNKTEVEQTREEIYKSLFGSSGINLQIEPPFYCDYGSNIYIGSNVFFNFNCVVLDPAEVYIGDHVLFSPAVQIYTATHPIDSHIRRKGLESAKPIDNRR